MAGLPGFEPGMAASKAAALPLGDRPTEMIAHLNNGAERDLNSHTLRRQNLNLVRLPIRHFRILICKLIEFSVQLIVVITRLKPAIYQ